MRLSGKNVAKPQPHEGGRHPHSVAEKDRTGTDSTHLTPKQPFPQGWILGELKVDTMGSLRNPSWTAFALSAIVAHARLAEG